MARSLLSSTRAIVLFSIFWWIVMQDHFMVLYWYGVPARAAIIDSATTNILLLLASLLVINTLRFYLPQRQGYLSLLAWCIVLTTIVTLLSRGLIGLFLRGYGDYLSSMNPSLIIRISFIFLILCCFTLLSVVWYSWTEQHEQEKRKQDAERLAREAELFKLRQQLQPHFLFNSLNSINALIGNRPTEARKMVQQLSDFLRGTIKKEEHERIALAEELQYLQLYLDIEKVRFGNRLTVETAVAEDAATCMIPALLLQPVVENAIKFGLYDTTDEIVIRISAQKSDNMLVLTISNPFDPQTAQPKEGTGFGLRSVRRRLDLLYATPGLLQTEATGNLFVTTIKVPQHV